MENDRPKVANSAGMIPDYQPISEAGKRLHEKLNSKRNQSNSNKKQSSEPEIDSVTDDEIRKITDEKWLRLLNAREGAYAPRQNESQNSRTFSSLDAEIKNRTLKAIEDEARRRVGKMYPEIRRSIVNSLGSEQLGPLSKILYRSYAIKNIEAFGLRYQIGKLGADAIYDLIVEAMKCSELDYLNTGFNPESAPKDGLEYEKWVADSLIQLGWNATPTKASGDQGIDVIARRKNKSVGIQCKLYSGQVGNAAVQEAYSGMNFYKLDRAAVVTTGTYTRSAQDLATATGVLLISHYDLPNLDINLGW